MFQETSLFLAEQNDLNIFIQAIVREIVREMAKTFRKAAKQVPVICDFYIE